MPERNWKQIKDVFHEALRRDTAEREVFLSKACAGDIDLRIEVESLLISLDEAKSFLEEPITETRTQPRSEWQLQNGQTISHYKVISPIGIGGMGEVYLAEDQKLHRKVALKILSEDVLTDKERLRRFQREAQAVSALNHPNILTIFEFDADSGIHLFASEYVKGETLREKLIRDHLPIKEALDITIQIASALQAAHDAGVIHRDIKPENVMIRDDGYVKVLDFGLAKLTAKASIDSSANTWTQFVSNPGVIMGTVAYMSPEQVRASSLDSRSDIFSLGVVLYEMLADRPPFSGESNTDVIAAIIQSDPPPLENAAQPIAAEIVHIVRKMLRKDKKVRYQSMKDLLSDLREVRDDMSFSEKLERSTSPNDAEIITKTPATLFGSSSRLVSKSPFGSESLPGRGSPWRLAVGLIGAVALLAAVGLAYWFSSSTSKTQIDSIAVLPFENRSTEPDTDYLSDGLTESLIYRLSQLPNLKVSPTNSVFRYKGKETDLVSIANELGVNAVLSGRIVQRGDDLMISAELVDVRYNKLLWGEQYDRKTADLLATQREIARVIVDTLKLKVSGNEPGLTKNYTQSNEAYQLYLKGRFYWNKRTNEGLKKSTEYYQQAIEKDPGFALAFAGLAESYVVPAIRLAPDEAMPKAKAAAIRALELDETLAEAHTALGRVLQAYEWDWPGAERELKRAIELNPRYAVAHEWYGGYFEVMGRKEEALAERKLSVELDPVSPIVNFEYGMAFYYARDFDRAIEQFRRTLELDPDFPPALQFLPAALTQKGMYAEAISEYKKSIPAAGGDWSLSMGGLGYAYGLTGRQAEARRLIDKLKQLSTREYVPGNSIALIYIGLGEKNEAFEWLDKAYEQHAFQMQWLKIEPRMDSLRSDPRFADLERRVGLPQ